MPRLIGAGVFSFLECVFSMDISLFQLVIICATIAVVLGFGIRAARSVHSTKGFSVGGRSAGVPLVAGG
ncbi:hypothetical protein MITSMUL_04933, partial [Mitsuokella multacida DSM 20544]